jgi:hypothetical protein
MKVVAQRAQTDFLIHVGDDERGELLAVVIDVEDKTVHRPFNIHSIIARGYWEDPVPGPMADRALELARAATSNRVSRRSA